ncbi:MAG: helix-turn-helix domain-containing protein [Phycisphaerae bacterium]|nr:helix-turn-helix domain-containing protein [Phycisphaerae bacterium]
MLSIRFYSIITMKNDIPKNKKLTISLKSLAEMLDCHRSSIRRWLKDAGIKPIVMGKGKKAAIRYRWKEIQAWLDSRQKVD